jgi:hypothetical protein
VKSGLLALKNVVAIVKLNSRACVDETRRRERLARRVADLVTISSTAGEEDQQGEGDGASRRGLLTSIPGYAGTSARSTPSTIGSGRML